jgi:predicted Zn-ribbon and HTH transcriptional regulator
MKPHGLIRPPGNMKRLFTCRNCGRAFWAVKIIFPQRCPQCGSFRVKEDKRVNY